jgi:hypothetical protein
MKKVRISITVNQEVRDGLRYLTAKKNLKNPKKVITASNLVAEAIDILLWNYLGESWFLEVEAVTRGKKEAV